MTDPKPAPGPWYTTGGGFIYDANDRQIAIVHGSDMMEVLATARVMTAGDRLLEAGKNVVDCWGVGSLNIDAMNRFVDELRAAIKSTEGPT